MIKDNKSADFVSNCDGSDSSSLIGWLLNSPKRMLTLSLPGTPLTAPFASSSTIARGTLTAAATDSEGDSYFESELTYSTNSASTSHSSYTYYDPIAGCNVLEPGSPLKKPTTTVSKQQVVFDKGGRASSQGASSSLLLFKKSSTNFKNVDRADRDSTPATPANSTNTNIIGLFIQLPTAGSGSVSNLSSSVMTPLKKSFKLTLPTLNNVAFQGENVVGNSGIGKNATDGNFDASMVDEGYAASPKGGKLSLHDDPSSSTSFSKLEITSTTSRK